MSKGLLHYWGVIISLTEQLSTGIIAEKQIGFPTANLSTENELIPHAGVYAVKIKSADRIYDGACSIGSNPTFGDVTTALEVFIFDFNDDLYGTAVRVFFIDRIRNECKFNDVGSLQAGNQGRCHALQGNPRRKPCD